MCVNCNTFPVDAAICLICGTTVCLQSNCCIDEDYNNRGECNMHTREYVCLSLSVCRYFTPFFFLLDVAELSEYIIVSRDVLCCISIRVLELLHHHLISMHMVKLIFRWGIFVLSHFFWSWSCFTTVVEVVDNSFIMQDGRLFVRLGYHMVYQVWLLESWRVVWILGVGKVCKRKRNVGFFEDIVLLLNNTNRSCFFLCV